MTDRIQAEGLGKRYWLGEDTRRSTLRDTVGLLARRRRREREELWPLRDVDLQVADGEALGVIGRNGAGKTTLLRLISRITEPTEGVVRTRGRVGSLLEVGTGFHPQLTGRENIYLNSAILGLRKRELDRRFDEIVSFAGFERFLDTPIKRYSTGMQLRLAFAVAAHIDTDILLIDEVLAVGDTEFQRRCMSKVRSVGEEGRTVVFVSHDLDAITSLCTRCIWIDDGRISADGTPSEVIGRYLSRAPSRRVERSLGTGPVSVQALAVLGGADETTDALRRDQAITIEVEYTILEPIPGFDLALSVSGQAGQRIVEEAFSLGADWEGQGSPGYYRARLSIPPVLRAGDYSVSVWAGSAYDDTLIWEEDIVSFRLEGDPFDRTDRILDLGQPIEVEQIDPRPT